MYIHIHISIYTYVNDMKNKTSTRNRAKKFMKSSHSLLIIIL
jgi:hypothetical protein